VNVDRSREEFGAVAAPKDIRVVTKVDLESVVGGQAEVAKVIAIVMLKSIARGSP
jgi:hypothetical protein